jgi:hypothetical protein
VKLEFESINNSTTTHINISANTLLII